MIELGQLEKAHAGFEQRNARVIVASLDDLEESQQTQKDFPHLTVVSDEERGLANAVAIIHGNSAPGGRDTTAPTTYVIDPEGVVRWIFRPDRFLVRLSPNELFAELDRLSRKL